MQDDSIKTIEYRNHRIEIKQDISPVNPREEWDNFGRMICFHKRYNLGDKHELDHEKESGDFAKYIKTNKKIVAFPVYMYDHSGLTISTNISDFRAIDSHGWDWGLLGWIYTTKENIRKEFSVKRVTKKYVELAKNLLLGEVTAYNDYLIGNVFGYEVFDNDGEWIDSCWGFYGDVDYVEQQAKEIVDAQFPVDEKSA
jgi:hypothetical protein